MSGILSRLLGSAAAAAITDAYFNLVTLLLNTTATNGAQNNTFLDSSTNNFSITRNGNTTQGTFTPFSQTGWSNYFVRANTDYLGLPNGSTPLGSNDFSIEAFVFLSDRTNSYAMFAGNTDRASAGGSSFTLNIAGTSGYFACDFWIGGSNNPINGTTAVPINTWTHLVVCRTGGTLSQFIDGVRTTTTTISGSVNAGSATYNPSIGSNGTGSADNFNGYISNLRLIIGSGGYNATSSTITVPTAPLTATANTKILSCQSNRFVDNSTANAGSGYIITPSGSPSVQAFSPFVPTAAYDAAVVGGSGYFDGTTDYLSLSSTSLNLGSSDFTIETWIYATTTAVDIIIGSLSYAAGAGSWQIQINYTSPIRFFCRYNSLTVLDYNVGSGTFPINQWVHLAVTRSGANLRVFQDGTQVGTTNTALSTFAIDNAATNYYIGTPTDISNLYTGYLSGTRVVVGTAVYTANFTPPTAPLTAITNTQLLTNYTNAGIFDSAAKNVAETVGTAQVSTTQAKFGATSMKFDGSTSSWLLVPFRPTLDLSTGAPDWTLECWGYVADFTNSPFFFNKGGVAATYYTNYAFSMTGNTSTGTVYCTLGNNGGETAYTFGTCSVNTWYHFAATRQGSTIRTFLNGALVTNTTLGATMTDNGEALYIGCLKNLTTNVLNGYVDDLRITKGYARYTATFTPPTAAFPLQ